MKKYMKLIGKVIELIIATALVPIYFVLGLIIGFRAIKNNWSAEKIKQEKEKMIKLF